MRSSLNFRFVLVCSLSLVSQLFTPTNRLVAQERKGNISGRVTDNSGGVLQGARIELEQKNMNLVSNGQGEFFINDLRYRTKNASLLAVLHSRETEREHMYLFRTASGRYFTQIDRWNFDGKVLMSTIHPCGLGQAVQFFERHAKEILVTWNEAFPGGIDDA